MVDGTPVSGGGKPLYYGTYPAIVEDVEDPDKLFRVKVRVFELFSDQIPVEDLPWAVYQLPTGARENNGIIAPCQVGDHVTIQFLYGDPTRPIITGSLHYAPDGKPNLPHEAWGGEDVIEHKRVKDETTPPDPEYPYHHEITEHGVTIEIYKDSTICVTHRETGSAVSIDPDGNIMQHSEKNLWASAQNNKRLYVVHDSLTEIDDNLETIVGIDETRHVKNDRNTNIDNDDTIEIGNNLSTDVGNNEDRTVANNRTTDIGVDDTHTIGNNLSTDVGVDETRTIGNNLSTDVGVNENRTVGTNRDTTIGANETKNVAANEDKTIGAQYTLTVGANGRISIGGSLARRVGGSETITIGGASSIVCGGNRTVRAPMIFLN